MEAITAILAALLVGALAALALQGRAFVRSLHDDRAYLRERVTDLERTLATHSWEQYAALSHVPTPLARSQAATNGFGEERPDEAYGSSREDQLAAYLTAEGVDLEGPTIG